MILYSIIPMEVIFNNTQNEDNNFREMDYLGYRIVVSHLSGSQYVINRLISTQPKAFLDPKLQPGTIINANIP